jgi:hypothetical protein
MKTPEAVAETGSEAGRDKRRITTRRYLSITPRERAPRRMLIRMLAPSGHVPAPTGDMTGSAGLAPATSSHLDLPHPRRMLWTVAWSMAESVGLPFGAYVVVTDVVSPDAGLLAGLAVVWALIAARKVLSGPVSSLLMISAVVLTVQSAIAISTGYMWMFMLQFPLAHLALSAMFARTAPTRKPLVAKLAAEVVALKQPDHPGLHRFFQGVTWFWAALFMVMTLAMAVMMATEPFALFMLMSTAATLGLTVVGACVCAIWFFAVIRRLNLRLRFSPT